MTVLLDTHSLLWYVLGNAQLSATAMSTVANARNQVLVSPASWWEIAIKIRLGKYTLNQPFEDFVTQCFALYRLTALPIEPRHIATVSTLPHIKGHRDPFDRMLISQALTDNLPIIGADKQFDHYGVTRIW